MISANFNENLTTKNLRIADLNVRLTYGGTRVGSQIKDYICNEALPPDITIETQADKLVRFQKENAHLSLNLCEYMMTGSGFYKSLLDYNGFMLHSSAVIYDGYAYLFSAPCGTGKSTHTSLWCERFGDKALILNDDKPAIRFANGRFYAYGTPWSGKSNKQINMCVPISAVAFISQSQTNSIQKLDSQTAVTSLLSQTIRPKDIKTADKLFGVLDRFVRNVDIYAFSCNMSLEAVDVAYNAMKK